MRISEAGVELVKRWESFAPEIYICPSGEPTIGYGHVVKRGETFSSITEGEATVLLMQDMEWVEETLAETVKVDLSQGQWDALASFVFNIGETQWRRSTLLKKLNKQLFEEAANEFDKWNKADGVVLQGLVNRRKKEKEMFLSS